MNVVITQSGNILEIQGTSKGLLVHVKFRIGLTLAIRFVCRVADLFA